MRLRWWEKDEGFEYVRLHKMLCKIVWSSACACTQRGGGDPGPCQYVHEAGVSKVCIITDNLCAGRRYLAHTHTDTDTDTQQGAYVLVVMVSQSNFSHSPLPKPKISRSLFAVTGSHSLASLQGHGGGVGRGDVALRRMCIFVREVCVCVVYVWCVGVPLSLAPSSVCVCVCVYCHSIPLPA